MALPSLTFEQLIAITQNFSKERKFGQGAYGEVFEGKRENGEVLAVKMLTTDTHQGLDGVQFKNVYRKLRRLKHQNILSLVGYYYENMDLPQKKERALCFGYWHNGSLQKHLSDKSDDLDWHTCYKIIKGTCEGLKYLLEVEKENSYYLDIKADNILLDRNMEPKLAYFGMSKLFGESQIQTKQHSMQTTSHNKDLRQQFFFALGELMIKISVGRKELSKSDEMPPQEFINLVHGHWRKKLESRWRGSTLEAYCRQVTRCTEIALNCMNNEIQKFPSIEDIILKLNETENEIDKLRDSWKHADEEISSSNPLIKVDPLELCFPIGPMEASCSLKLINTTSDRLAITWRPERVSRNGIAFNYFGDWTKGIVPPRSTSELIITRVVKTMERECTECGDKIILRSTIVEEDLRINDITDYMFNVERDVKLNIVLIPPFRPYYDLGLLDFMSDYSSSSQISTASKELLKFDALAIPFPFEPDKEISCSVQLVNHTDDYVAFWLSVCSAKEDYDVDPRDGILPPRSAQEVVITNQLGGEQTQVPHIMEINSFVRVWSTVVNKGFRPSHIGDDTFGTQTGRIVHEAFLDIFSVQPSSKLPESSLKITSDPPSENQGNRKDGQISKSQIIRPPTQCSKVEELVKFEPPVIHDFLFSPNKKVSRSTMLVNNTDDYVAFFSRPVSPGSTAALYYYVEDSEQGILPPRSVQKLIVTVIAPQQMTNMDASIYVYSAVVNENFEASNITDALFKPKTAGRVVYRASLEISRSRPQLSKGNLSPSVSQMDSEMLETELSKLQLETQGGGGTNPLISTGILGANHLDIHSTKPLILATRGDGRLYLWNYETQEEKVVKITDRTEVSSAIFIPRKQWILVATAGSFYMYTDDLKEEIYQINVRQKIMCLAVHPFEPYVLSGHDSQRGGCPIYVRDYRMYIVGRFDFELESPARQLAFYNSMGTQFFARSDGQIKIWNLDSGQCNVRLKNSRPKSCVDYFTRDTDLHLIVSFRNTAEIWDGRTNRRIHILEGHMAQVSKVCSHPSLPLLITGSHDGSVRLWNSNTFRHEGTLNIGLGKISALACLKGSTSIVIGCDNGIAVTESGNEVHGSSMGRQ